jgi:hypothetical protein
MTLQLSPSSRHRLYLCGTIYTRSCRKRASLYAQERKKTAKVFLGVTDENIRPDKRNQQMVKEEMDNQ